LLGLAMSLPCHAETTHHLPYREYWDKVPGGWLGKAPGLALGVPKEYCEPWPPSNFELFAEAPDHFSNRTSGDDVYAPLVLQLALQKYGTRPTYDQYMRTWDRHLFSGKIWVFCQYALDHYRPASSRPRPAPRL
jgi:hypothetical protein